MFNSDKPIEGINDDLLNRGKFVKQLSNAIINYDFNEPLVLGLNGEWGSGKSSIINMTTKIINDKNNEIKVIKFNPWNYSEQNNLLLQYFNCLDTIFKQGNEKESKAKILLNKYSNSFSKQIYKNSYDEVFYNLKLNEYFNRIKNDVTFEKFGIKLSNVFSRDDTNQTLSYLKENFSEALEQTGFKILVVIDDIDRCNNSEIKQIFQLVKSLADFPRIMYLLSFDDKIVLESLKNSGMISSDKYLEKIIQVSFNIPTVRSDNVINVLIKKINFILNKNQTKFYDSYNFSLNFFKMYINNIRDVNRYCNLLKFELPIIKSDICINDFLLIIMLKLFEPNLYEEIHANKTFFTSNFIEIKNAPESYYKQNKDFIKNIIQPYYSENKPIEEIFYYLFPMKVYSLRDETYTKYINYKKNSRLCSKESFDNYFTLNLSDEDISNRKITQIIQLSNNKEIFEKEIIDLNKNKKINSFLDKINIRHSEIPTDNIPIIIEILLNFSDTFWEEDHNLEHNNDSLLNNLYFNLFKLIEKQENRFKILNKSIKNANKSVYSYISFINKINLKLNDLNHNTDSLIVSLEQFETLKKLASHKINSLPLNLIFENKYSQNILITWSTWAKKEELKKFFKKVETKNEYLIKFVTLFKDSNFDPLRYNLDFNYSDMIFDLKSMKKYENIENIRCKIEHIPSEEYYGTINEFLQETEEYSIR